MFWMLLTTFVIEFLSLIHRHMKLYTTGRMTVGMISKLGARLHHYASTKHDLELIALLWALLSISCHGKQTFPLFPCRITLTQLGIMWTVDCVLSQFASVHGRRIIRFPQWGYRWSKTMDPNASRDFHLRNSFLKYVFCILWLYTYTVMLSDRDSISPPLSVSIVPLFIAE